MAFSVFGHKNVLTTSLTRLLSIKDKFADSEDEPPVEKFIVVAKFEMDKLVEADYLDRVEKIRASYPDLGVNNFFKGVCKANVRIPEKYFYIKLSVTGSPDVFILYSYYDVSLVAVKVSDSVLFVKGDCPDVQAVSNLLVKEEGVSKKNISIHGFGIAAENVTYSRESLVAAVCHLGQGFGEKTKLNFYAENLSRLQGFGSYGAVFPDWGKYVGKVYSDYHVSKPTWRMACVIKNWSPLSEFVLKGGRKELNVSGVDVTLKNISSFVSVVNTRAVWEEASDEAAAPASSTKKKMFSWANKAQSKRKNKGMGFSTLAEYYPGVVKFLRRL